MIGTLLLGHLSHRLTKNISEYRAPGKETQRGKLPMKRPKTNISNVKLRERGQKVVTPRSDVAISSGKIKNKSLPKIIGKPPKG